PGQTDRPSVSDPHATLEVADVGRRHLRLGVLELLAEPPRKVVKGPGGQAISVGDISPHRLYHVVARQIAGDQRSERCGILAHLRKAAVTKIITVGRVE